jgi:hypothetical protein
MTSQSDEKTQRDETRWPVQIRSAIQAFIDGASEAFPIEEGCPVRIHTHSSHFAVEGTLNAKHGIDIEKDFSFRLGMCRAKLLFQADGVPFGTNEATLAASDGNLSITLELTKLRP